MLSAEDKRGGAPFVPSRAASFRQCVDNCNLLELDFVGPRFTWFRGSLGERLDWGLSSTDWKCQFPNVVIRHIPRLRSDHRPILLCFHGLEVPRRRDRPFRFLVPWMNHSDFPKILDDTWDKSGNAAANLLHLAGKLRKWNKEVFGDIFRRKAILIQQLSEIEDCGSTRHSADLEARELRTRKELEQTLWEEAVLWKQKACKDWIRDGDRNTRFFHLTTLKRRSFNKIAALKRADGTWEDDAENLKCMALLYFKEVYREERHVSVQIPSGFIRISPSQADSIRRLPSLDELHKVVKSMGGFKALGKDGFHPIFFQKHWDTVGSSIAHLIQS
ncbi:hypothetical protein LINPERHAP2_LOCUS9464 [Linum perenne]